MIKKVTGKKSGQKSWGFLQPSKLEYPIIVSLLSSGIFQDIMLKFGVSLIALDLKLLRNLISGCQLPLHFFENLDIYFSKFNCTKTKKDIEV